MKTAEEWNIEMLKLIGCEIPADEIKSNCEEQWQGLSNYNKAIQLDAFKAGAKWAAGQVSSGPCACECSQSVGWKETEQAILTAAEKLEVLP
jgi:hypothetical protein